MKPVQILIDEGLLQELDREAERAGSDRSKLIRAVMTRYLRSVRSRLLEEQDRQGYEGKPQTGEEIDPWQDVQAWPED